VDGTTESSGVGGMDGVLGATKRRRAPVPVGLPVGVEFEEAPDRLAGVDKLGGGGIVTLSLSLESSMIDDRG
jgi:hypothetical protein